MDRRCGDLRKEKSKFRGVGSSRKGLTLGEKDYMVHLIAPANFKIVGGSQ